MRTVWVLMKQMDSLHPEDPPVIIAAYESREDMLARVKRIGEANSQYVMMPAGSDRWRIGPDDDEGFFGNKAVFVWATQVPYKEAGRGM